MTTQSGHVAATIDLAVSKNERVITVDRSWPATACLWDGVMRQMSTRKVQGSKLSAVGIDQTGAVVALSEVVNRQRSIGLFSASTMQTDERPLWRFNLGAGRSTSTNLHRISTVHVSSMDSDPANAFVATVDPEYGLLIFQKKPDGNEGSQQVNAGKGNSAKDGACIAATVVPKTGEIVWLSILEGKGFIRGFDGKKTEPKATLKLDVDDQSLIHLRKPLEDNWVRLTCNSEGTRFLVATPLELFAVGERTLQSVARVGVGGLGPTRIVDAVLSPNGDRIAIIQAEETSLLKLLTPTGDLIRKLEPTTPVLGLDASVGTPTRLAWTEIPDGSMITSSTNRGLLRFYFDRDLQPAYVSRSSRNISPIEDVSFDPTGKYLFLGFNDLPVVTFDLGSGRPLPLVPQFLGSGLDRNGNLTEWQSNANSLSVSPSGDRLAIRPYDKVVFMIDLANQQVARKLMGDWLPVGFLDRDRCVVGRGTELRVLGTTRALDQSIPGTRAGVLAVMAADNRVRILSDDALETATFADGTFRSASTSLVGLQDLPKLTLEKANGPTRAAIEAATFSPDGSNLLTLHKSVKEGEESDSLDREAISRFAIWNAESGKMMGASFLFRPAASPPSTCIDPQNFAIALSDGSIHYQLVSEFGTSYPKSTRIVTLRGGLNRVFLAKAVAGRPPLLVATFRDGSLVAWDRTKLNLLLQRETPPLVTSGSELFTLAVTTGGDWAVTDPELRFDASNAGAFPGIRWNVAGRVANLDDYAKGFLDPGLLAKCLNSTQEGPKRAIGSLVTVRSPLASGWIDGDHFRARILSEPGDPVNLQDAWLYVNGLRRLKLSDSQLAELSGGLFSLPLGDPSISRVADSGQPPSIWIRTNESVAEGSSLTASIDGGDEPLPARGSEATFVAKGRRAPGRVVALCIGINRYDRRSLSFAAADAKSFANLLNACSKSLPGSSVDIVMATTEQVTSGQVRAALNAWKSKLKDLRGGDTAIFYFAGHGRSEREQFEMVLNGDPATGESITMADLLEASTNETNLRISPPYQRAFIIDACESGQGIKDLHKMDPDAQENTISFLASATNQALENAGLKHGVLSFSFLEAVHDQLWWKMRASPGEERLVCDISPVFDAEKGQDSNALVRTLKRFSPQECASYRPRESAPFEIGSVEPSQAFSFLDDVGVAFVLGAFQGSDGDEEMNKLLAENSVDKVKTSGFYYTRDHAENRPGLKVELLRKEDSQEIRSFRIAQYAFKGRKVVREKYIEEHDGNWAQAKDVWAFFEGALKGLSTPPLEEFIQATASSRS